MIDEYNNFTDSTKWLIIKHDLYNEMTDSFLKFLANSSIVVISDENTKKATGNDFITFCKKMNIIISEEFTFNINPELTASYKNVETITNMLKKNSSIPIAIGSGTINDIVKRASFEVNRPYAIIATAASVDGYASDGAALLYNGFKQTLPCPAPVFIASDPDVLISAPIQLASAGYADLIAKNPAGADWIIADSLGIDPIDKDIWKLIQNNLLNWTSNPEKLLEKDKFAFEQIFKGLTVSGFAMQYMKRSRPVSGTEHLMSHIWEMEGLSFKGKHISHGFKVALGSLASIALIETVMKTNISPATIEKALDEWPSWNIRRENIINQFTNISEIDNIIKINRDKYINKDQLIIRLNLLLNRWNILKKDITNHLLPYNKLKEKLSFAGCPTTPQDIGLTKERVINTYKKAQMLRNRFTILDLTYELGLMNYCTESILDSNDYLTH